MGPHFAAGFALLALSLQNLMGAGKGEVDLAVPRPLLSGEVAFLEVRVGSVLTGEIEVTTPSGRELGVISAFGIRAKQEGGTYTLPVPSDTIVDGHIVIRLSLNDRGTQRPPTITEVKSVRLKVAPAPR